jgi:hypothetical protein
MRFYCLLAVVVVGVYAFACWLRPYRACRRCEGSGKRRSRSGRAWRPCRPCNETGQRLRFGRRLANWVVKLHRDAN